MTKTIQSIWKDPEEYFKFGKEHKVWGGEAIKLKERMDKKLDIGEPKIQKGK